jgi:hypothetical protein
MTGSDASGGSSGYKAVVEFPDCEFHEAARGSSVCICNKQKSDTGMKCVVVLVEVVHDGTPELRKVVVAPEEAQSMIVNECADISDDDVDYYAGDQDGMYYIIETVTGAEVEYRDPGRGANHLEERRSRIRAFLAEEIGPEVVMLDGPEFDDGIIGHYNGRVVYSRRRIIDSLRHHNGWSEEDAVDWVEFNTIRSLPYMGERAPIVVNDIDMCDF